MARQIQPSHFQQVLKPRDQNSHKGDFGHVLVVAGSDKMPGSGYLSSHAALRAGAGLVTYALPKQAYQKFDPHYVEVMMAPVPDEAQGFFTSQSCEDILNLCEKKNVVVLGPGMGRDLKTVECVLHLLEKLSLPLVLDADGLYAVAQNLSVLKQRKALTIVTPHVGEMALLTGKTKDEIEKHRDAVTSEFAKDQNVVCVLKGYQTLIGFPEGQLFMNPTGNPGMATAGSGDVLAGIIAGFIAQKFSEEAAILAAVYLHGRAGDLARDELGEKGMIAPDLLKYLPKAMTESSRSLLS